MWKKIKPYVIAIAIALAVGGLSALFTKNNMDVYERINRPMLAPPMIVFPIVWSVLFILMGIGSAIVYLNRYKDFDTASSALKIYAFQLVVNFFWSIIFFNLQAYLFAFIWLIVLWILILLMIIQFYKISPLAAYLQIPYLLWVTFAGYLTFMIYLLNG
ncbi:MAG: tryptophan-rich sensory protein [Clostridia bacterium]|nr:tryptophan-rich sensory protein [Clostridia bacterium]